jgi:hypothetical protein
MAKVAKFLRLSVKVPPERQRCDFGTYRGWEWNTIAQQDPEWVLWLITESRVLLKPDVENFLLASLKNLTGR